MKKIKTQKANWKLPIKNGMPGYIQWHGISDETIDPFVFHAKMRIVGFVDSGWSKKMELVDVDATAFRCEAFLNDAAPMIERADHGVLEADFNFMKRQNSYGIKLMPYEIC